MPLAGELVLAAVQPLDQALGGGLGVAGVDPLLLAGALLLAQPGGAGVPVVDLAGQPCADLALDLVDLGDAASAHLGEMGRDEMLDRVAQRLRFDALGEPGCVGQASDQGQLVRRRRPQVEIGGGAGVDRTGILGEAHELQPLRDGARLARARRAPVADGVLEIDQQMRCRARVGLVDQDRTLAQQGLEALEHEVDHGAEQGMAGRRQLGLGLAGDQGLLEGDPGVAVEHGVAAADQPVAPLERPGHAQDLEPAALALGDAAAEQGEGLAEEGADEVRLQAAGGGALHLLADRGHALGVHVLGRELALGHAALPPRSRWPSLWAFNCGLRRGGILRITKADIDFKERIVHTVSKGRAGGKPTPVPLTDALLAVLMAMGPLPEVGAIFQVTIHELRKDRQRARKAVGQTSLRFIDHRHDFAQGLEDRGLGDLITDALHHSDPKLKRRYSRVKLHKMGARMDGR